MPPDVVNYTSPLPDTSNWFISIWNWIVNAFPHAVATFKDLFGSLVGLSLLFSLFFFIGIIYCVEGLKRIRIREGEIYEAKVESGFETVDTGDRAMAHRWQSALNHIASDNPNDWKQAIIEADIMLDDLLSKIGYKGETIGEKLKRVAAGDMKSLNEAWEAHKVRNQIAHETGFTLNHSEANDVIGMYRKVFEEFYYV